MYGHIYGYIVVHIFIFAFAVTLQRNSVEEGLGCAAKLFLMFHFNPTLTL